MKPGRSTQKSRNKTAKPAKASEEEQPDNPLFPVVGIGASAGGLEAFSQLISHLPIDTGMAFVIIQHLAPDRHSCLSELLAESTPMPVSQVQHGMAVAPNQIYVIPPNVGMIIAQGVLQLTPRPQQHEPFMSVDTFLLSLAEERKNKAIAVILSGRDGDGSHGLAAVKAAGGITFVQSPDTARVDNMPNMAIATGQVDFILSPEKIAEKIAEISRPSYIVSLPTPNAAGSDAAGLDAAESDAAESDAAARDAITSSEALTTIFCLLRTATGVDFTQYKQTTFRRRMQRRMALYQLEHLEDYARYLQNTPAEVIELYQDVLINVTSFFRDPESFEVLKSRVFPEIVKDRLPSAPIRIWVAGCSTGEEAYSIAICLLEFLADRVPLPIQIYATDISEIAIARARKGFYLFSQVANVSPQRLQRFFDPVEGGYQIHKSVRELCVFAKQNLIGDPPFSRMDLIVCRNVLIYLSAPLQRKLLPIFHYGLKPTGFLMLGSSETAGDFLNLFSLFDKGHKLYQKNLVPLPLGIDWASSKHPAIIKPQTPVTEQNLSDLELQKEADRIVLDLCSPIGVVINPDLEILQFRGKTSAYLEPAPGRASFDLLRMAKEGLRPELLTAIQQAKLKKQPSRREGVRVRDGDRLRDVRIDVIPFQAGAENYFLVLFEDIPAALATTTQDTPELQTADQEIAQLRQELKTTKGHLQSIIEEQQATNQDLRAANEEILSSNEELQSINEELETAKEEIQATNEELNTINEELQRRNIESTQVSNDLQNLLSSSNIPILMLGGDLKIRRFTPAVEGIFNLIATDVGRPVSDITHRLNIPDLEQQILEVIRTLTLKTLEIQDLGGHWYDLQIRPYRTIDNKIDGAVVRHCCIKIMR